MLSRALLALSLVYLAAGRSQAQSDDDETCLMQQQLQHRKQEMVTPENTKLGADSPIQTSPKDARSTKRSGTHVCHTNPGLCKPPFNCHTFTAEEESELEAWGVAAHGRANPRAWCMDAFAAYAPYAELCMGENRDLVKAGHVHAERTKNGLHHGLKTLYKDASACFVEGHCVDEAVTPNTTLAEAEQLCDAKYGRHEWTASHPKSEKWKASVDSWKLAHGPNGEFSKPIQTTPFMLAACAMGNYHCDVVSCKETYCKNPMMVSKYGHLLHELGWIKKEQYLKKFAHFLPFKTEEEM